MFTLRRGLGVSRCCRRLSSHCGQSSPPQTRPSSQINPFQHHTQPEHILVAPYPRVMLVPESPWLVGSFPNGDYVPSPKPSLSLSDIPEGRGSLSPSIRSRTLMVPLNSSSTIQMPQNILPPLLPYPSNPLFWSRELSSCDRKAPGAR